MQLSANVSIFDAVVGCDGRQKPQQQQTSEREPYEPLPFHLAYVPMDFAESSGREVLGGTRDNKLREMGCVRCWRNTDT